MEALRSTAIDLVSWRDEKLSAAVLGAGLMAFYVCTYMPLIAFFSYSVALSLLVRLVYYHVHRYLVHAKLAAASPAPVIPSEWLTEAEMMEHLRGITATVNSFVRLVFSLLYMESTELGLKCIAAFGITGYIARQLGTSLLFLCLFLGAFTLPKAYELKQPEVDAALAKARSKLTECHTAIMAKAQSAPGADVGREKKKL